MPKQYEQAYIEGLMERKVFIYSVLAYDSRQLREDGNGYIYDRDSIIRVTASNEEMALAQARQLVQDRREYLVVEVNERIN